MMTEDLATFFSPAEHALQVVLDNAVVAGIFDNAYREAVPGIAGGIATSGPALTLPTAQCLRAKRGSTVTVPDVGRFTVTDVEPDGTGVTLLRLAAA